MSALNQGGLQVWLRRAVWLLLLGSFGCIFLVIALRGHWSLGSRKLLFCALLAAGVFLLRRFLPLVDRLTPGRWRAVFGGGLVLLFALQLGSGFLLLQDLTTSPFDTEAVLRTATELAQGTVPALYNDYFCQCGHQRTLHVCTVLDVPAGLSAYRLHRPRLGHGTEYPCSCLWRRFAYAVQRGIYGAAGARQLR